MHSRSVVDAEYDESTVPAMKRSDAIITGIILAPLFILSSIYLFIYLAQLTAVDTLPLMLTGATTGVVFSLVWMPDIIRTIYLMRLIYIEMLYSYCAAALYLFLDLLPVAVFPFSLMIGLYIGRRSMVRNHDFIRYAELFRHASIFIFGFSALLSVLFGISVYLGGASTAAYRSFLINGMGISEQVIWLVLVIGISLILLLNYVLFMLGVRAMRHPRESDS